MFDPAFFDAELFDQTVNAGVPQLASPFAGNLVDYDDTLAQKWTAAVIDPNSQIQKTWGTVTEINDASTVQQKTWARRYQS